MRYLSFFILVGALGIFLTGVLFFSVNNFSTVEEAFRAQLTADIAQEKSGGVLKELRCSAECGSETSLLFVGDIMLSRAVGRVIKKAEDPRFPFLKAAKVLQDVDLVFGNLEGPISDRGANQGSKYSFRADPEVVGGLVFSGFDVLSLANNHILDWGREALQDTLVLLAENGIATVGAGRNASEANAPVLMRVDDSTVAFLGYTTLYPKSLQAEEEKAGISRFNLQEIQKTVKSLQEEADVIVVSFHWGEEYQGRSGKRQQEIAHALIDAGADLVIGHHPHVIQEVERYRDGWIAYSLGNFVFDQNFSDETQRGLMMKAIVQEKKIINIQLIEVSINEDFQPEIGGL